MDVTTTTTAADDEEPTTISVSSVPVASAQHGSEEDTEDDSNFDLDFDNKNDEVTEDGLSTTDATEISSISQSLSQAVSAVSSTLSSLFDQTPTEDYSEIENSSSNLSQPSVIINDIEESLKEDDNGEDRVDNGPTTEQSSQEEVPQYDDVSSYEYDYEESSTTESGITASTTGVSVDTESELESETQESSGEADTEETSSPTESVQEEVTESVATTTGNVEDESVPTISAAAQHSDTDDVVELATETEVTSTETNDLATESTTTDEFDGISCENVVCQPPEGFESCTPMPTPEGACCPEQYECSTSTTEGPVTVTVSTDNSATDALLEVTTEEVEVTTKTSCEDVVCQPPEGFESCTPLPTPEGACCPEQYECSSSTTESPVTITVSTEESSTATDYVEEITDLPEISCEDVICQPPEGFESCTPLPKPDGVCCPEQYECNDASTTEGPVTVIVTTTEGSYTEAGAETETQSIQVIVTEPDSSITTDATDSVMELINDQEACTDENGNIFNHLDDVPNSDPCKLCQCTNGVVVCAQEECTLPEPYYDSCKPLPIEDGKCCPQYECELPDISTSAPTVTETTADDNIQFDDVDGEEGSVEYTNDNDEETSGGSGDESFTTTEANTVETTSAADSDQVAVASEGEAESSGDQNIADIVDQNVVDLSQLDTTTEDSQDKGSSDSDAQSVVTTERVEISTVYEQEAFVTDLLGAAEENEGTEENSDITTESSSQEMIVSTEAVEENETEGDNLDITTDTSIQQSVVVTEAVEDTDSEGDDLDSTTQKETEVTVAVTEEASTEKENKFDADLGLILGTDYDYNSIGDTTTVGTEQDGIEVESISITTEDSTTIIDSTNGTKPTDDSLMCLLLGRCNPITDDETTTLEPMLNTGECYYNGNIYQDFDDVPSSNPCNLCYCSFGEVICAERECLAPEGYEFCEPIPAEENQCCPTQWECNADSTTGAPITTVIVTVGPVGPDGASITTVLPNENNMLVGAPPAPPPMLPCTQEGATYDHNSSVPVTDICDNSCLCYNGKIECDQLPCHPAPEELNCTEVYVEGECCPSFECTGDELPKPDSGSHTINEMTTANEITTEETKEDIFPGAELDISRPSAGVDSITNRIDTFETTTSSGIYDDDYDGGFEGDNMFTSCQVNGSVYENLQDVPSSDPCQLCQCFNGDVICAVQECVVPDGCKSLPIVAGECCPSYQCDDFPDYFETTPSPEECGPCNPPTGYEFCTPLPAAEGDCCPTQWECNAESTTGAPITTVIVTTESELTTVSPADTTQEAVDTTTVSSQVSQETTTEQREEDTEVTTELSKETTESEASTFSQGFEVTSTESEIVSEQMLENEETTEIITDTTEVITEATEAAVDSFTDKVTTETGLDNDNSEEGSTIETVTDEAVEATTELIDVETEGSATDGEEAITETSTNAAEEENVSIIATTAAAEEEIVSEIDSSTTTESSVDISTDIGSGSDGDIDSVETVTDSAVEATTAAITEASETDRETTTAVVDSITEDSETDEEVTTETSNDAEETSNEDNISTTEATENEENISDSSSTTESGDESSTELEIGSGDETTEIISSETTVATESEQSFASTQSPAEDEFATTVAESFVTSSIAEVTESEEITEQIATESQTTEETQSATETGTEAATATATEAESSFSESYTEEPNKIEEQSTTSASASEDENVEVTTASIGSEDESIEVTTGSGDSEEESTDVTTVSISSEAQVSTESGTTTSEIGTSTVSEISTESETLAPSVTESELEISSTTETASEAEVSTTVVSESEGETSTPVITESATEEDVTTKKPSRDFCIHKGMIIQNLADVPSKDSCELCQCVDGEIICATQECQPPPEPGCVEIKEEGACCPKYDCEVTTTPVTDDLIKTTQTSAEIQDDDVGYDNYEEEEEIVGLEDDAEDKDEDVGEALQLPITTKPEEKPTTAPTFTSPKPVSTTQLTTLLTTTLAQEGIATTVTPAPVFGTESGDVYVPGEEDYPYVDIDSIGPGACLFENKIYVSAQQIPRDNPCDFCFCFRGDIICLQQSCPPPIPGCTEEIIGGFCCPRYECPVKMSVHNVTHHVQHKDDLPSIASWFLGAADESEETSDEIYSEEIEGCEVQGEFYEVGSIVSASSGPCLQCR